MACSFHETPRAPWLLGSLAPWLSGSLAPWLPGSLAWEAGVLESQLPVHFSARTSTRAWNLLVPKEAA